MTEAAGKSQSEKDAERARLKQEAEVAWRARDHARARQAYRALIAAGGRSRSHYLRLARTCHALKDSAGIEEALALLQRGPQDAPDLLAGGEMLKLLGLHEEAVSALRASAALAPLPLQGWRLLIGGLRQAEGVEAAARAAAEAGAAFPDDPGLPLKRRVLEAEGAWAARDHARVRETFRALLVAEGGSPVHCQRLARACHALKDSAGLEEARALLQQRWQDAPGLLAGGEILKLLGRHEEAVNALRASAALAPLPLQGWRLMIDCLRQAEGTEAAARAAAQAVAAFPGDLRLQLKRLELEAELPGSLSDSAAAAARVLAVTYGDRPEVHLTRLRILKIQGDKTGARAAARAFLKALPDDRRARLECARQAMAARDHQEALEHYQALREREPERCEHHVQIARCCNALGDLPGEVDSLCSLEKLPESAAREHGAAQILQSMHLHEEAVEALKRALALDPTHWPARQQIGTLLARLGRGEEGLELLEQIPAAQEGTPEAAVLRARLAWALGRSKEATTVLEGLGARHSFASQQQLVSCLIHMGALERAEGELAAMTAASASQRAQIYRSRAEIARWRYNGAAMLAHCDAALAEEPDAPATLQIMAHAHLLRMDARACIDCMIRVRQQTKRKDDRVARPYQTIQGQIANELLLEPQTTELLSEWMAHEHDTAIATIAEQVLKSRNTGPALALLITARRRGLLEPPGAAAEEAQQTPSAPEAATGEARIPPIIHQYWEGPMPSDVAAAIGRMQSLNLWAEHRLYTRQSALDMLRDQGLERAARAFRIARHAAERADIFRLALLLQAGGFYVDVDDLCARSLAPLAEAGVVFICRQEHPGTAGNNFIAATAGHPILADALDEAVEETLAAASESIWLRTGPALLTRACARHMAEIGPQHFARSHRILTNGAVRHYLAVGCPLSYKLDQRNWTVAERYSGHRSVKDLYASRRQAADLVPA